MLNIKTMGILTFMIWMLFVSFQGQLFADTSSCTSTPGAVQLTAPSGIITDRTPALTWTVNDCSTWYQLYLINTDDQYKLVQWYEIEDNFPNYPETACSQTACEINLPESLPFGDYQWWIRTWNDHGNGDWSGMGTFTIASVIPDKIIPIAPSGTVNELFNSFDWEKDEAATWYKIFIQNSDQSYKFTQWYEIEDNSNNFPEASCAEQICSVSLNDELAEGDYTWWVRGWNEAGNGPWSDGMDFSFEKITETPSKIILTGPSETISGTDSVFTWQPDSQASWYKIFIQNLNRSYKFTEWYEIEDNSVNFPEAACDGESCFVIIDDILAEGSYTWWAMGWNEAGNGEWSDGMDFTVEDAVFLTDDAPDYTVTSGSETRIYGSEASNQITLESGAKAELIDFPGQNMIKIQSNPYFFTLFRSGSVVTFAGSDGTQLKIPATSDIQTISFFCNENHVLQIHNNQLMLDDQVIGLEQSILPGYTFLEQGRIPDTGQDQCYGYDWNADKWEEVLCPQAGDDFYGQDGNYLNNLPSFSKLDINGNELPDSAEIWSMVRDNVTGLIWEIKNNIDGIKDYSNIHDADNTYTWYNPDTSDKDYIGTQDHFGRDTDGFIKAMNETKYGGYNDWRIPNVKELYSIGYLGNILDDYFLSTNNFYWTSDTKTASRNIWLVDNLRTGYSDTSGNFNIRAVRGCRSKFMHPLIDNGDGTITDPNTGLMWQKRGDGILRTWENALDSSESLLLAGYDDWRLPNIKEIVSIVDFKTNLPFYPIYSSFLENIKFSNYWSSTSYTASNVMTVYMGPSYVVPFGTTKNIDKFNTLYSLAVRDVTEEIPSLHHHSLEKRGPCGAYIAPGVWKEFDCYNLAAIGKTTNDDPFTPSWRLIGGYWQWGRKGPDQSQWYDTNTEHFAHGPTSSYVEGANDGDISGWNRTSAPDGAWSDSFKSLNDPCPEGFRVPSSILWEAVIANNTNKFVGSWTPITNNYSSACFLGNNLMLPSTGYRDPWNSSLYARGNYGPYLSSTGTTDNNALVLHFNSSHNNPSIGNGDRISGLSVRCIAEETSPIPVFTVTYHGNVTDGGSPPVDSNKYEVGAVVTVSENTGNLVKPCFDFDNWKDGNGETREVGKTFSMPAENMDLYAQWRILQHTVTFNYHDGTVTEEVECGSSATAPDVPEREGSTFAGWDEAFDNITNDLIITAQYVINEYTVTFLDHDGNILKEDTISHGSVATAPADPVREGYTFKGWNEAFDTITSELTVTAQYEILTYEMTYSAGENGTITGPTSQTVNYGENSEETTAQPDTGFHFVQWSDGSTANPRTDSNVTDHISVTAAFAINQYKVTVGSTEGGSTDKDGIHTIDHGGAITLSATSDEGYHFTGWSGAGTGTDNPLTVSDITADQTITATFSINQYTVLFQDHDGSDLQTVLTAHGSDATPPVDNPVRVGYTFTGWDKQFVNVSEKLTVTAQYIINTYTVTFLDHDGTVLKKETVTHGSAVTAPEAPTRKDYSFVGWDNNFDQIASNLTVTALYEICSFSLSSSKGDFSINGGNRYIYITASSSDCQWSISETLPWVSVSQSSGIGSQMITISVTENTGITIRNGNISIADNTYSISQECITCSYELSSSNMDFSSSGGSKDVTITTNNTACQWSVSETLPWVTVSPMNGIGNETVTISVEANKNTVAREGIVTIAGITYAITQQQLDCTFSLSSYNGDFASSGESKTVSIKASDPFCEWSVSENLSWVMVLPENGRGDEEVTIYVDANADYGRSGSIELAGLSYDITQARSVALAACGAFVAPGVWKEFDCYNLAAIGKTTGDNFFTPSWRLIGGYWQWGRKGPDPSQWYNTNTGNFAHGPTGPDSGDANSGNFSGWSPNDASKGAWSDSHKTANDPCPAGYRVPTQTQWDGVQNNNTQSTVGSWSSSTTNFSSVRFFGRDLMLPAAGNRSSRGGALGGRGSFGHYWSSSEGGSNYAWYLYFTSSNANMTNYYRRGGRSVRCVAE
jgi:uncharacterized protein (TIGR02145 family)/uncharacterized repeat protein (TIGR02543 family)